MALAKIKNVELKSGQRLELPDPTAEVRHIVEFDKCEFREVDDKLQLVGHAAVFDRLSEDLGGFRERIMRGAFRKVLDNQDDVRLLINHDSNKLLARTTNGTLELRQDPKGLRVFAELAPTTYAKDLQVLLQRGDMSQMSFAFRVGSDTWTDEDGELIRSINEFESLFDVSVVTYPAYPQTDVSARSICGVEPDDIDPQLAKSLAWAIHREQIEVTDAERQQLDTLLQKFSTVSPWTAERTFRAVAAEPELLAAIPGQQVEVEIADVKGAPHWRSAARRRGLKQRAHLLRG